jgi:hypothetical protein
MSETDDLTHAKFADKLNSTFQAHLGPSEPIAMTLIEVSELRESPRQERFSLLFRGPLDKPLPQFLYRMEHEQIGVFELFLVPVGQDDSGLHYEAVFNRLRKPDPS